MRRSIRRGLIVAALAAVLLGGVAVACRQPILTGLGNALIAEDQLVAADVVVITLDAGPAGTLEAADLVHAGIAPRVAVFADPPDAMDREFLKRNVAYENKAAISVRQLGELGVREVIQIPREADGTESESRILPAWCAERGYRTIVVVTGLDHSRRVGRVLRRVSHDRGLRILIRGARHSEFAPGQWWRTRAGTRIEIVEMQKLLLDVLRHPLS